MKKAKRKKRFTGKARLKGNIVIAPPFKNKDGVWVEWTPWDEI